MFLGVDFGAKLAGTTVICFAKNDALHLSQSAKKQDADTWLRKYLEELAPHSVFIDAPLSLPLAYSLGGTDYHFRACDRAVGAMSPMFLGGLTARAMQLSASFRHIAFREVYPAHLAKSVLPKATGYKTDLHAFVNDLEEQLPYPFAMPPENWHQADATMAWLSGWRHEQGRALCFGQEPEGLIWV